MNELFGLPAGTLLTGLLILTALIVLAVAAIAWRYPLSFRLGLRNLPRRKGQTALVIGGLALSTLIITSALGIGDTIDYSTRSGVYQDLGTVDIQLAASPVRAGGGPSFGLQSGGATASGDLEWFDARLAGHVTSLVDRSTVDGALPAIIQTLPVASLSSELSEAAVEIRGLDDATGIGFTAVPGLDSLDTGQVLINASLARAIDSEAGDTLLLVKGMPAPYKVAGVVPDGGPAGSRPALLMPLAEAQALFGQPGRINTILVSNVGDAETGAAANNAALARLRPAAAATGLVISSLKVDALEAAAASAEFVTTLFITFGTFSILAGILLIFLIFTVLAAERQSELGISRAVGQQRADLIRQFVVEGLAYNIVAAAIGAALGVGAALLLAGTVLELLTGASQLDLTPRVSLRSVGIGYTLGLAITFLTVTASAVRISKVNIIAAIRNLNIPRLPRPSQWTLFLHPLRVYRQMLSEAGQGNVLKALRLFLFAAPKAIWDFWMGLLARGPVLLAVGFLFAWVGVNVAEQAGVYGMGVALFIIGLGQLLAWIRVPVRLAYSLSGLALVLYWSLPTRDAGRLAELGRNPGDFFISGLFMVGGAILLFLYNADQLLALFAGLLSRVGRLLPVARVAIAYPVAAKGRTATTLAMFSLIIFTLVGTATISNTFSNFLDVESGSGGYEVLLQANPFNPVPAETLLARVDELVAAGDMEQPLAVASAAFGPVEAQAPGMPQPAPYAVLGVDDAFFATHSLKLGGIARGYNSEQEVWDALRADPTLVVVDNFSIQRSGDPTFQRTEGTFAIASISAGDSAFEPTAITIAGRPFTVIGVLNSAPAFYGATMSAKAAAGLGFDAPNRTYLRLSAGSDARAVANALERSFSRSGLQSVLLKEELAASRRSTESIFYLVQGFVGLGLLIGIAALGVITIRAVVERRQQIGVLRAIGFQRGMVQAVFLLENLFVAGLGTFIGYALALSFSYNLYLQVAADQGLAFLPPWATLAGIGVAVLAATLLTAWLHARQSARVVIAEALRYQG
jgi:putative ABC transport system permease protein